MTAADRKWLRRVTRAQASYDAYLEMLFRIGREIARTEEPPDFRFSAVGRIRQ